MLLVLLNIDPIDDLIEFLICFSAESPRFFESTWALFTLTMPVLTPLAGAYGLLHKILVFVPPS